MTYEIITFRWSCQECGAPLHLHFSQNGGVEENREAEYVCAEVACPSGHHVPEEVMQDAIVNADEEFYAALERGSRVGEIWQAPGEEELPPSDQVPPEE